MIVTFTSHNKAVKAAAGENLLDIISRAGIILDGSCGGNGNCGCCKVQIVGGRICALTPREKILLGAEEIAGQYRLACHVRIDDDLQVKIPRSRQTDNRKSRLNCLPSHFYLPPGDRKQGLGIAFDVGTTTVAGLLWDMGKAELLDAVALTNPQSIYGADVISRINFCGEAPANLGIMQKKIIDCCNHILHILLAKQQRAATEITEAVMVGNSTMSHIFLGISPASLAALPFLPAFSGPQNVTAAALGLGIEPGAVVYVLPNIAGHVGSDISAGLMAADLWQKKGNHIFLDMGTNGEIVLFADGNICACSTAAGPAFEGASIEQGMRAVSGAVEGVSIESGQVKLKVIDQAGATGICGSGLIDTLAALLENGLVQKNGRLIDAAAAEKNHIHKDLICRLQISADGVRAFLLQANEGRQDLRLTQRDIREVQLGKGAIACGINILLQKSGLYPEDIDSIVLAGAFGNFINKKSAQRIGLLPAVAPEKIHSVGNAAGIGASMALLSDPLRLELGERVRKIDHVELAGWPGFQEQFLQDMSFPGA